MINFKNLTKIYSIEGAKLSDHSLDKCTFDHILEKVYTKLNVIQFPTNESTNLYRCLSLAMSSCHNKNHS